MQQLTSVLIDDKPVSDINTSFKGVLFCALFTLHSQHSDFVAKMAWFLQNHSAKTNFDTQYHEHECLEPERRYTWSNMSIGLELDGDQTLSTFLIM